jgi:hypothetical protein
MLIGVAVGLELGDELRRGIASDDPQPGESNA